MRLIILDFDGTIGDTRSIIVKTLNQTLSAMGFQERSSDECASTIGLPLEQAFKTLIPTDDDTAAACAATYRRLFEVNNTSDSVSAFPHVSDTINELHKRGCTLTIASSRGHDSICGFLRNMGLYGIITYIIGADDLQNAKPHPEAVLKTLAAFRCRPEDAIVVGDTVYDIEMGKRAGTKTIGVTYGNGTREQLEAAHADYIVDSFDALSDII